MSAGSAAAAGGGGIEPRHGVRIAVIWAVVTAIAVPLIIFVAGPHIPPFDMSLQSETQHTVNVTLLTHRHTRRDADLGLLRIRDRRLPQARR